MRVSQFIQFILIALIIIGLFAAMARNNYGFDLVAMACFGLAILYGAQLLWKIVTDFYHLSTKDISGFLELFLLSLLIMIFGFRFFYINLPAGETLFTIISSLLLLNYVLLGYGTFKTVINKNSSLAKIAIWLHASLCLFILSMLLQITNPDVSKILGVLGLVIAIPFLYEAIRSRQFNYSDKTITAIQFVIKSKSKAGLLFAFFISAGFYLVLADFGIIPKVQDAEKPKAYLDLINNAETGKEKPVDGKYQHEKYKEAMDTFLKRQRKK